MKSNNHPFYHCLYSPVTNLFEQFKSSISFDEAKEKCLFNFIVLNSPMYSVQSRAISEGMQVEITRYIDQKISLKKICLVTLKVMAHSVFLLIFKLRMLFRGKKKYKAVLKSWIDVNFSMYQSDYDFKRDSLVLALPFPLGFVRQIKYLKSLFVGNYNFELIGMPYAMNDYFRLLRSRRFLDLFLLEYNASYKFGHLVCKRILFENYLVMDDVEPVSYVSNEVIKKMSLSTIICRMHGIGTYSPFIFCDSVRVFNPAQKKYYSYFNSELHFDNVSHPSCRATLFITDFPRVSRLIFFSGAARNVEEYTYKIELRIVNLLVELCKKIGVVLSVKLHPNSSLPVDAFPCFTFHTSVEGENDSVSCSLYSTSYYTFGIHRSFLIETPEIPTKELFGEDQRIVLEKDLLTYFGVD